MPRRRPPFVRVNLPVLEIIVFRAQILETNEFQSLAVVMAGNVFDAFRMDELTVRSEGFPILVFATHHQARAASLESVVPSSRRVKENTVRHCTPDGRVFVRMLLIKPRDPK